MQSDNNKQENIQRIFTRTVVDSLIKDVFRNGRNTRFSAPKKTESGPCVRLLKVAKLRNLPKNGYV